MKKILICMSLVVFFTSCGVTEKKMTQKEDTKEALSTQGEKIQMQGTEDDLAKNNFSRSGSGMPLPNEKLLPLN